ncbi:MAG: helix-turn-helix transcriptional regulator [Phormidesmis sp.]
MAEEIKVHSSSGNVFADLGLPNADEWLVKAELAHQISEIIAEQALTQVEAAAVLEIDQPKVSALIHGKLSGFSIERLFRFLNMMGRNVEIRVTPNSQSSHQAQTRVVAV